MNVALTPFDLLEIERELCRRPGGLARFAKRAWHILEPQAELKWGWALDAMCQHLEAVTSGEITRLLANVPPGMMKSLLTGVIWPAWEWGPMGMPWVRYLGTAHKADLAIRDSTKCRRLIQSEWYQRLWPVELVGDQNAKTKFENSETGFREAMAFTSMTGSRGDRVGLDDPLSVADADSPAELLAAERAFTEALPTRVNNDSSAIVVIMQRLHEKDTSGIILSREMGYVHLCLPMEFEPDRKCYTCIGFEDPRTEPGELLFPERFSEKAVKQLKKDLGSYAAAGQLQQRPAPRGGGMFKREWFQVVDAVPAGARRCRGWDLAATVGNPNAARTAGVKISVVGTGEDRQFYVEHVVKGLYSSSEVTKLVSNTASQDGKAVKGSIPQDPGAGGKAWARSLVAAAAGYDYRSSTESGSKEARARPFAAQAEAGNVFVVRGKWNEEYFEELENFPMGEFKDQVDASTRAFDELVKGGNAKTTSARVTGLI